MWKVAHINSRSHCYAFKGKIIDEVSNAIITCTILVFDQMDHTLFDIGYTYSYLSVRIFLGLDLICDILDSIIYDSTLVENIMAVTHVYACFVLYIGF